MFWKNFQISHKMFLGFGIVTLLMLSVLGYSYINFNKEGQAMDWNVHSYEVIREVDAVEKSLVYMQTGARGYAIAGKDDFLAPYNKGKADFDLHFNKIKGLTSDNPLQQTRLDALKKSYEGWLEWETNQLIVGRQKVNNGQTKIEDLIATVQTGIGKKDMDGILTLLGDIIKDEQGLLSIRTQVHNKMEKQTGLILSFGGFIALILAVFISILIIRIVVTPVKAITKTFIDISQGDADFEFRLKVNSNDELGEMARKFNIFMDKIERITIENRNEGWIKTGQTELNEKLRVDHEVKTLATDAITYISKYLNAQIGAIYVDNGENIFNLSGSYAYKNCKSLSNGVKLGEGIVGQAALEKQTIIITDVPEDYIKITSGVGEGIPRNILVTPCIYGNEVKCIIEIGLFQQLSDLQIEFVERISGSIAIAIHSVESRIKMQELLDRTVEQSEELQVQQEELRQSNEELEEQAKALKESEAQLQAQQEELQYRNEELEEQTRALKESELRMQSQQEELKVINEELEERTISLELQKNGIAIKNDYLKRAQVEIEEKAKALEITGKYKSEFLANMSHELRTPLNSILVLSQMLAGKKDNTPLTDKQLEFANTIRSSGEDLLKLINDILDLSKVEAGKMDVILEPVNLSELVQYLERSFKPIALQKGIELTISIDNELPESIISDALRLQQIVNNLLSNAFKFTSQGVVNVSILPAEKAKEPIKSGVSQNSICISITDTGIGIPKDKQSVIFEAFKQSDGTTSRKYGGTGLGLSISKELARLLGGQIYLESEEGKGSTFSIVLPENHDLLKSSLEVAVTAEKEISNGSQQLLDNNELLSKKIVDMNIVKDDQQDINVKDKILLIVEDDINFSKILCELAHEKGYKCVVAITGLSAMELAEKYKFDGILLDIGLPDISGWKVIEKLQENKDTRNIPVHVISGTEKDASAEYISGIISYLQKPVSLESLNEVFTKIEGITSKPFKKLLVLDESIDQIRDISEVLGRKGIQITSMDSGRKAYNALKAEVFDCIILDLKLKDMSGLELLAKLRGENIDAIPVIIHTEKILTVDEESELQKYADSIVIKGSRSIERLVGEANLFLHDVDSKIEEKKTKAIRSNQEKENTLKNKKILVVDDDMRNVFALSSILEDKGISVVIGRNGKEGIQKLEQNLDIDLILMDIMMPEMDGYTAMREIRKQMKFSKIPIIALTAKAMKDDKQKCIEAGASDYLTKPIDNEKLISLLRVWLYK